MTALTLSVWRRTCACLGDSLVELCKVLGRSGTKLDLIHLPIQTPAASQFGRRNILALFLRLLKIPPKAFPDLGPQSETRVGVVKNLAQFLLHHFADDRPPKKRLQRTAAGVTMARGPYRVRGPSILCLAERSEQTAEKRFPAVMLS
jgi:hypothetical protein